MKKVAIFMCALLIGCMMPLAGGQYASIATKDTAVQYPETTSENMNPLTANYFSRIVLIGIMSNYTTDELPGFGVFTQFYAVNVLGVSFYKSTDQKMASMFHYKNVPVLIFSEYYKFHGILTKHIICGVIKLNE